MCYTPNLCFIYTTYSYLFRNSELVKTRLRKKRVKKESKKKRMSNRKEGSKEVGKIEKFSRKSTALTTSAGCSIKPLRRETRHRVARASLEHKIKRIRKVCQQHTNSSHKHSTINK